MNITKKYQIQPKVIKLTKLNEYNDLQKNLRQSIHYKTEINESKPIIYHKKKSKIINNVLNKKQTIYKKYLGMKQTSLYLHSNSSNKSKVKRSNSTPISSINLIDAFDKCIKVHKEEARNYSIDHFSMAINNVNNKSNNNNLSTYELSINKNLSDKDNESTKRSLNGKQHSISSFQNQINLKKCVGKEKLFDSLLFIDKKNEQENNMNGISNYNTPLPENGKLEVSQITNRIRDKSFEKCLNEYSSKRKNSFLINGNKNIESFLNDKRNSERLPNSFRKSHKYQSKIDNIYNPQAPINIKISQIQKKKQLLDNYSQILPSNNFYSIRCKANCKYLNTYQY